MATVAIDTYKVITKLQAKGFTKEQAEALVSAAQEIDLSGIATKADIVALRADFKEVEGRLQIAMKDQAMSIVKWMTGILIAQGALIVALIQYFK